ncbi:GNAT family N-acetyltransferase [Thiomicrospira sp. S5]|jgi:GNAT superfamily N-acetyltransferase|uniref:GNAT family N-acetyltransferase n=1 Tax=Thiomicrospira sp. S5 TaxID=1803865 RepID=UPI0004A705E5|nr:GNAT family N-acetyltransferase [Thiomicrospira sp. S5]AZR81331.1 hypothetical protein AYJ59_02915 [Thiomicrospira sp. S5]AZR81500.1 hypothetical protein AYJ59_03885 [Thiomicrospira sp. S5]
MSTQIRQASFQDIPEMVVLLKSLFALEADFDFDIDKQVKGIGFIIENKDCCYLVAESNNHVIGICSAQWVYSTSEGAKSAWIEDLIVHPTHQGKGIGKLLLNAILDWCEQQGCTRAQLVYDKDNTNAIAFYEKAGWQMTNLGVLKIHPAE